MHKWLKYNSENNLQAAATSSYINNDNNWDVVCVGAKIDVTSNYGVGVDEFAFVDTF